MSEPTFKDIVTTILTLRLLNSGYDYAAIAKRAKVSKPKLQALVSASGYRKVKGKYVL